MFKGLPKILAAAATLVALLAVNGLTFPGMTWESGVPACCETEERGGTAPAASCKIGVCLCTACKTAVFAGEPPAPRAIFVYLSAPKGPAKQPCLPGISHPIERPPISA